MALPIMPMAQTGKTSALLAFKIWG